MSLYTCPICGYQDNTAGSGYHAQRRRGVEHPVCSACNPEREASEVRRMGRPETPNG